MHIFLEWNGRQSLEHANRLIVVASASTGFDKLSLRRQAQPAATSSACGDRLSLWQTQACDDNP
ncbi:hypothetical protein DCC62_19890, partial [candidate division KSB1 bacterium]